MKDKFTKKYMQIARVVGEVENSCYSRHIGTVIVDPRSNSIIGTGYNSPPQGTPHCDSEVYLREYFLPQLTDDERRTLNDRVNGEFQGCRCKGLEEKVIATYVGKGICPRKLVGAQSGERLTLCSCDGSHSESNALLRATQPTIGCYMYTWCGCPCRVCAGKIINAGIARVYCLKETEQKTEGQAAYRFDLSKWLLSKANIEIIELSQEELQ